ncbi:MAG: hypothetical protein DHS20C17_02380 [Cyclobacteriaceae bacterium]|nr:MAG: hypothetical protein DHS20C17_02380 [Cyclobacteriaceae bacterium]
MDLEKGALEHILRQLKEKAGIKQLVYRNTLKAFEQMRDQGRQISDELREIVNQMDSSIAIEYEELGEFEFRLKFGGDILIFYMQSNIITFKDDFPLMQRPSIAEDPSRRYFGHITIYNFLADSIKYSRLNDPGYLIARMLINKENHFYVEGSGQLNFLFQDLEQNLITSDWLRLIIEKSMSEAMDKDLIGANYPDIRFITLKQKLNQNLVAIRGEKIGFQLSTEDKNNA